MLKPSAPHWICGSAAKVLHIGSAQHESLLMEITAFPQPASTITAMAGFTLSWEHSAFYKTQNGFFIIDVNLP